MAHRALMAHIPPIRRIGRLRRTFHPHGQPFPGTWTLTRDSGAKALTRSTAATNITVRASVRSCRSFRFAPDDDPMQDERQESYVRATAAVTFRLPRNPRWDGTLQPLGSK